MNNNGILAVIGDSVVTGSGEVEGQLTKPRQFFHRRSTLHQLTPIVTFRGISLTVGFPLWHCEQ